MNPLTEQNKEPKANIKQQKPLVILIHGLHQRHWIMKPLAYQLEKLGYQTICFDYYSLIQTMEQHSTKLNELLQQKLEDKQGFHLVAHSLGGLVIRDFITRFPQWHKNGQVLNCVTLGTPHMGSTTADYAKKLMPLSIGHAYKGALDGQTPDLPKGVCLGVIAGNRPYGLGQPVLAYHNYVNKQATEKQHDGTVYLHETQLPTATDHITISVTHSGMIMDKEVVRQTDYFLKNGKFIR